MHRVESGERIYPEHINQFVDVLGTPQYKRIFGTTKGQLINDGNSMSTSRSNIDDFNSVAKIIPTEDEEDGRIAVALGGDYKTALTMLDVDRIFSVNELSATEISDYSWYGYLQDDKEKLYEDGDPSNGVATTHLTISSDIGTVYKGFFNFKDENDETKKGYIVTTTTDENKLKKNLQERGISAELFYDIHPMALKTSFGFQNVHREQIKDDPIKQFTLRGVVETRTISSDEGDKKQYRWKAEWFSHYDAETQTDNYAVKFNDKDIRFDGGTSESTPMEGWNEISSSEKWEDSISVDTDVYLNVQVDLLGYEEHKDEKDEWKYNEGKTCYSVEVSALSSPGWFRRGSVVEHDEGGDAVSSDGYYVRTSYKIGSININDERVTVKQIFDGTQTFVAPFFEDNPISSDEVVYDVPDSEIKEVGLSSLERNLCILTSMVSSDVGGKIVWDEVSTAYECWSLYDFRDPEIKQFDNVTLSSDEDEEGTKRQFVIREEKDNGEVVLRYAELSIDLSNDLSDELSDINKKLDDLSTDAKADSELSSLGLSSIQRFIYKDEDEEEHKAYSLFNFDRPDNDLVLRHKDLLNDKWKVLVRDGEQKTLRYAEISSYSADSQATNEQFNSIEIDEDNDVIGLYNFRKDEGHDMQIAVPNLENYYFQGENKMEPKGSDSNMDLVVRNKNAGQHTIDYRSLSIEIPPFVHGDADDFIGPTHWSIDSVPNTAMPEVSYYQLHNFGYPNPTTVNNNLVSGDYYNLANGKKKGEDDEDEDLFLIRNEAGELVYRKLYAKSEGGGSWDEQRIVNIETNINNVYGDITDIHEDISYLSGVIYDISSQMSSLTGDYWEQGGDSSTNYGSSIGNSSQNTVIDLDERYLGGSWWINSGNLDVDGDITTGGDAEINGKIQIQNGIGGINGDLKLNSDLDADNHSIKNLSEVGDIDLLNHTLDGDWQVNGSIDATTTVNAPMVNCVQINSATGDKVDIGGNLNVIGTSIKIGNTTLTETQLQQLLALLNSSNNILNQQF